jgi:cytochrome c biogenesis protein CcdA
VIYLVVCVFTVCFGRRWPSLRESLGVILGLLSVFSGLAIFCVFVLTKPPAIDKISDDSRAAIGLVCAIVLSFVGIGEVVSLFKKSAQTNPSHGQSPSPRQ